MVINQKWFVIKRGLYNIRFSKQAIGGYTYHHETWRAELDWYGNSPYLNGPVMAINWNDTSGADIGLFMSKDTEQTTGAYGVSVMKFLCGGDYWNHGNGFVQKPAPSINEKQSNIILTAKVNNHLI